MIFLPVYTRKVQAAEKHIERALKDLPFYVVEYVRAKKRARYSPDTLSGYLHDYKRFFDWLREQGFTDATSNRDIHYSVLENIKKQDIEYFFEMLTEEQIERSKGVYVKRSEASVNRFIQSLKSLFNYLTIESEKADGECYFYRNVMAKIKTPKNSESIARRAKRINSNMLSTPEQIDDFIDFIKEDYETTLSPRQQAMFLRNKARDIAICSLILDTGIRVNEVAGLLLTDIDFINKDISVLRKGNTKDTVEVTETALYYLKSYLKERESRYRADESNPFVFLTIYAGKANPISTRTIQIMINRYSQAYLSGKRLSPHQLRHSFAKRWLDEGGSLVGLRDQLGHNSIETTTLYTNFSKAEQRKVLDRIDDNRGSRKKP